MVLTPARKYVVEIAHCVEKHCPPRLFDELSRIVERIQDEAIESQPATVEAVGRGVGYEFDDAGLKDLTLDKVKCMLGAHNDGVYKLQARWNIGTVVQWLLNQIEDQESKTP